MMRIISAAGVVCAMLLTQNLSAQDPGVTPFTEDILAKISSKEVKSAVELVRARLDAAKDLSERSLLAVLTSLPADSESAISLLNLAEKRLQHRPGLVARAMAARAFHVYLGELGSRNPHPDHQRSHALYMRCHALLMQSPPLSRIDEMVMWGEVGDSYMRAGMNPQAHEAYARVLFHDYKPPGGIGADQRARYDHAYHQAIQGYMFVNQENKYWLYFLLNKVAFIPSVEDKLVPLIESSIVAEERRLGFSQAEQVAQLRQRLISLARKGHKRSILALEPFLEGDRQVQGVLWSHVDVERPYLSTTSLHSPAAALILARGGEQELSDPLFQGFASDSPDRVDQSIRLLAQLGTAEAFEALFERIEESDERPPRTVFIESSTPEQEDFRLEEPRLAVGLQIMQALGQSVEDPPYARDVEPSWEHVIGWRKWYQNHIAGQ